MAIAAPERGIARRMPPPEHGRRPIRARSDQSGAGEATLDSLLARPEGKHLEWVNGQPVERDMGFFTSLVVSALTTELNRYVREAGLGWIPAAECGYQCFEPERLRVRKPDVSFISVTRMPAMALHEGFVRIPPDLAVEVVSPKDLALEVQDKIEDYLQAGVRLVWVIYPETGVAEVLRADGSVSRLTVEGFLDGEDVIPGFQCRLADLIPSTEEEPESAA